MSQRKGQAGFTLIEALLATLLMTVILAALATVTAQWLPNWNKGMARVQRAERLAIGIDRVVADLAAAEMIPINAKAKAPLFIGSELTVTFVRAAVGPNARPGLEVVRLIERADDQGLALVRERATFTPMQPDDRIQFSDPIVLIRAPYRVSFSYAGADGTWQPTWSGGKQLPHQVRITVRDAATAQVLAASSAALVHVNAPAECVSAKSPNDCLADLAKPITDPS